MSDQSVERSRHISITRTSDDGSVTRTEVHITEISHVGGEASLMAAGVHAGAVAATDAVVAGAVAAEPTAGVGEAQVEDDADDAVCFDPTSCCGAREQAMIAALRAYLRPEVAPECLMAKLKATLDRCCGEDGKR